MGKKKKGRIPNLKKKTIFPSIFPFIYVTSKIVKTAQQFQNKTFFIQKSFL